MRLNPRARSNDPQKKFRTPNLFPQNTRIGLSSRKVFGPCAAPNLTLLLAEPQEDEHITRKD